MSNISEISVKQLKRALVLREKISKFQGQLEAILGHSGGTAVGGVRKRRKMSASARAKIAAAQRKRWAAVKAAKGKG